MTDILERNGWDAETIQAFQKNLLDWYDAEKRDLPWRRDTDPYHVWVSEIMLQQTQVVTVIPYYERFMERYPTIKDLAESDPDELLKYWEGLGYYNRVRNMQTAAQQIMERHDGVFPENYKDILDLKGIGPYTAGAIASIAFNQAKPAVDGNVMRVFARLLEIDADVKSPKSRKIFEEVVSQVIPEDRPGDFNQALMDLGATICTPKNYDPSISPVKDFNASYKNGTWMDYPVSSKGKKAKPQTYFALIIQNDQGKYLLEKRPKEGLLANMWTFPLLAEADFLKEKAKPFPGQVDQVPVLGQKDADQVKESLDQDYQVQIKGGLEGLGTVTHVFSHLKWTLHMYKADLKDFQPGSDLELDWVAEADFADYVFPKPQQKMVEFLQENK